MADSDTYAAALRRAIALLQMQLALLAPHDQRRAELNRDLCWCHHEAFALLWQHVTAEPITLAA